MTASPYAPDTLTPADTWHDRALCRPGHLKDISPDLWFADKKDSKAREKATAICRRCPVRTECEEDALTREGRAGPEARSGIRAGLSGRQRHAAYRRRARRMS